MSGEQLERRYRGLLRVLPKPYREAREEELLSVLMDGAAEGRRWPELREVFSMTRLGLRVRVRGTADGSISGLLQSDRFGEMARFVSLLGTLFLAYFATMNLAFFVRELRKGMAGGSLEVLNPFATGAQPHVFSPQYRVLAFEVPVCWLIVAVLLALGWWRAARVSAVVLVLADIVLADGVGLFQLSETLLPVVTTAALFATRGPHARGAGIRGFAAVAAVIAAVGYAYQGSAGNRPTEVLSALERWGMTDPGLAVAAVAVLAAAVGLLVYRSAARAVAVAVVGALGLGSIVLMHLAVYTPALREMAPLVLLVAALVAVAALAVLRERRVLRSAASRDGLPVS